MEGVSGGDINASIDKFPKLRKLILSDIRIKKNAYPVPRTGQPDLTELHLLRVSGLDNLHGYHSYLFSSLPGAALPHGPASWGSSLQRLVLDGNNLHTMLRMTDVPWYKTLKSLSFNSQTTENGPYGDTCIASVVKAMHGGALQELELTGCVDFNEVTEALNLPMLRVFKWEQPNVLGLQSIYQLPQAPRALTAVSDISPLQAGTLPKLERLHIYRHSEVRNIGALAVGCPALTHLNLQRVDMDNAAVGDLFLKVLPQLVECNVDARSNPAHLEDILYPMQQRMGGRAMWPLLRVLRLGSAQAEVPGTGRGHPCPPGSSAHSMLEGCRNKGHFPALEMLYLHPAC